MVESKTTAFIAINFATLFLHKFDSSKSWCIDVASFLTKAKVLILTVLSSELLVPGAWYVEYKPLGKLSFNILLLKKKLLIIGVLTVTDYYYSSIMSCSPWLSLHVKWLKSWLLILGRWLLVLLRLLLLEVIIHEWMRRWELWILLLIILKIILLLFCRFILIALEKWFLCCCVVDGCIGHSLRLDLSCCLLIIICFFPLSLIILLIIYFF